MKVLVTGAAGFIGYHLCEALLKCGYQVVGLDNLNDYYDVDLKFDRLGELGITKGAASQFHKKCISAIWTAKFTFVKMHLQDRSALPKLFHDQKFDVVFNLAAQAGVRYSLENPQAYLDSNINGFLNILECSRNHNIKHLVYASSSSVYGLNDKIPFSTNDTTDSPISLYAATKKSNELMAYTYSHLYGIPSTGLRFFTVYGPWGRPDMAMFLFTDAIVNGKPLKVFNNGQMERDFTYIEDIVKGLVKIMEKDVSDRNTENGLSRIYNMGNNKSVKLMDFIAAIEHSLGIKGQYDLLPMQPGDVEKTWANVDDLIKDFKYFPNTPVSKGIESFIGWYKSYYGLTQ